MSQNDFSLANADGATFRADANSALQALASLSSGTSAPTTTYALMWWADTTNNVLKQRNAANTAWVIRDTLDDDRVLVKTANYTVALGDMLKTILADPTSGNVTITLPAAATAADGFKVKVVHDGTANKVTIDGNGAELIDGAATYDLLIKDDSAFLECDGTGWRITLARLATVPLPTGYLQGLGTANNGVDAAHDIDIAAGSCRDDADSADLDLASTLVKQIDAAWAVGTNAGGLDTGTVAADTTYHLHLIKRSDTGVVDALFSLSATAPTMPTNYDKSRRIGSVVTDSSSNILAFVQTDDVFRWDDPVGDVAVANPGDAAVTRTLTVPTGISVKAVLSIKLEDATSALSAVFYVSDLAHTDITPALGKSQVATNAVNAGVRAIDSAIDEVVTDSSGQVRSRMTGSLADTTVYITTLGWIDARGKGA